MVFALKGAQESAWILYEGVCSLKVQELRLSIFVLGYERIGIWKKKKEMLISGSRYAREQDITVEPFLHSHFYLRGRQYRRNDCPANLSL